MTDLSISAEEKRREWTVTRGLELGGSFLHEKEKGSDSHLSPQFAIGSGAWIRTTDLRVMRRVDRAIKTSGYSNFNMLWVLSFSQFYPIGKVEAPYLHPLG